MNRKAGTGHMTPPYTPPQVIKIGSLKNGVGDFGIESTCSPSGGGHWDHCDGGGSGAVGCQTGSSNLGACTTGSGALIKSSGGLSDSGSPGETYTYGNVAVDENGDAI